MIDGTAAALLQVGFDEKQANVYLALLQLGEATATQIAEQARLKRTVTYAVLEQLKEKGFVSEVPHTKIKRYLASDPLKLIQNVQTNFENLRFMLPVLRAMHNRSRRKPRIEFYEKREALTAIYRMFEVGMISRYLTSYGYFKKHFPDEYRRWLTRTVRLDDRNQAKQLVEDDEAGREYAKFVKQNSKQEFRFLEKGKTLSMEFAIVDDAVAITSFDPVFLVIIHSKPLAESAALLFDMAWHGARKG